MTTAMLRKVRLKSCPRCTERALGVPSGDMTRKEYVRRVGNLATVEEEWACLQCGYHEEAK